MKDHSEAGLYTRVSDAVKRGYKVKDRGEFVVHGADFSRRVYWAVLEKVS